MILPIGDTPNPPGFTAWVTRLLLLINVAVYALLALPLSVRPPDPNDPLLPLVMERIRDAMPPGAREISLSAWDLFVHAHGYKPGAPELSDLFTAMFLHANFAHLAGNMLFLWIYGDNVEHRLGRLGYLAAYLGTGIAATLAFSLFAQDPAMPLVGASGAISGLLGAYFLLFPRNRIKVFVFLFPFLVDVWLVPAPIVLGLYLLVDNLLPILIGAGGGVAYGAHLGGFLAGAAVAWVASRVLHARDPASTDEGPDPQARFHLLRAEGLARRKQRSAAYQEYLRALQATEDPILVSRARAGLRALGLDPRLSKWHGL